MRIAVFYGPKDILEYRKLMNQNFREESLIKIKAAGICRSDFRYYKGERRRELPLMKVSNNRKEREGMKKIYFL